MAERQIGHRCVRFRGQTLLEILVVAGIILILLTMLGVMLSRLIRAVLSLTGKG